jgi:hypothetical protein
MSRIKNLKEGRKLDLYRTTLANASTDEKFSIPLKDVGFSAESIDEGQKLYDITWKAYNECLSAQKKRFEMHKVFHEKMAELDEKFRVDWKKSKIIFRSEIVAQDKLGLKNRYFKTNVEWIELARQFYTELSNNPELTEKLSKRNFSSEETETRLTQISEIEVSRAAYIYEKGISQDATNVKAEAFEVLNQWMNDFFSLAKIAFRRNPQLIESFGKVVKN